MSLSKKLKLKKAELIAVGKQKREDKESGSIQGILGRLIVIEEHLKTLKSASKGAPQ